MMYRCDLLEDPGEMAAFKDKYGYDLNTAFIGTTTYQKFHDVAEFFTRKKGEMLKGEVLDHDFYGIGLMAGRHTQNADEIFTIAWTYDGDVLNADGSPGVADAPYIKAMHTYVDDLLPFAPPGSLSGSYDFVVGQFRSNLIAITGPFYLDQWPNAVKMEVEVPGTELCIGGLPAGGETWAGPFTLGINKSSKHPDQAFQFLKWITGPEAQRKFALGGGSTVRLSILKDPEVYGKDRNLTGHFPALADVLDHAGRCWYTNFLWTSFDAKIYEESAQWHSAANSRQMSVEDAMSNYAKRIEEICGGNCPLVLEGVPKQEANCEYSFDSALQMRKPK
jgi:multiple sugar transport system substrate-binding protein